MKKLNYFIPFALLMMIFFGCKKDNTGPQGPAGAAGTNGNALLQSDTITISSWNWNGVDAHKDISQPIITQQVLDRGLIMVYKGNTALWNAMPFISLNDKWTYTCSLGNIRVIYEHVDGTSVNYPPPMTFKIAIVTN